MDPYKNRQYVVMGLIVLIFCIYMFKLLVLQVFDDSYQTRATQNVIRKKTLYPNRGLVYDRNGKLIIYNDAVYDLYVTPKQVKEVDSVKLCELLDIDLEFYSRQLKKAKKYSYYKASLFLKQIEAKEYARFQEYIYQFPGFYGELRTIRKYPYGCAAHVVGEVSEVDSRTVERSDYYRPGDYMGKSGIEKTYENFLRGKRGSEYIIVDVLNRTQGKFRGGDLDTLAIQGSDIFTSLDIDLQLYGELLMQNKRGSIVAIEPATGEILALVSSPAFDPNMLSGRRRGENYQRLQADTLNRFFNRPIMAPYPPGSTFKPLMALMGMQEEVLKPSDGYKCLPGYRIGSLLIGCRHHPQIKNLSLSLQYSCNAYYCHVFREVLDQEKFNSADEALTLWDDYLKSFGIGIATGIDIPDEKKGWLPTPETYNSIYPEGSWKSSTIISLSIGQGELGVTPLQLANMGAAIANKGYYYPPHFATKIVGDTTNALHFYNTTQFTMVDSVHFPPVIEGMYQTVEQGSARASKIEGIEFCGKTGTSQNPHGEDHSVFIGFAPKDNPKIVVAAIVENAGGGSRFAAPLSSLMIEQYLTDSISTQRLRIEERILNTNLINPITDETGQ